MSDVSRSQQSVLDLLEAARDEAGFEPASKYKIQVTGRQEGALSPGQEGLWYLHEAADAGTAYSVAAALLLEGPLDCDCLKRAVDTVVRRHDVLRTRFPISDDGPVQVVEPSGPGLIEDTLDENSLQHRLEQEFDTSFNIAVAPPVRWRLFRLGTDRHVLLFVAHHLVADAWSFNVICEELSSHYQAGGDDGRADLPVRYMDYAAFAQQAANSEETQESVAAWQQYLSGAPVATELPVDRPHSDTRGFRGATTQSRIGRQATKALRKLCDEEGATLFTVVLSGLAALLRRMGSGDDLVIGTPVAGRERPEVQGLVGYFLNTLALRLNLAGASTFRELIAEAKEVTREAFAESRAPYDKVLKSVCPHHDLTGTGLFQVMLILQNVPEVPLDLAGVLVRRLDLHGSGAKFDLTFELTEHPNGIGVALEYALDLFETDTAKRLADGLKVLLSEAAKNPDVELETLPVMSKRHMASISRAAVGPKALAGRLDQLVRKHALDKPDCVALVQGAERMSYGALMARVDALAGALHAAGLRRGDIAAVVLPRSMDEMIAPLATWRCGAAYVVLDPKAPEARIADIVSQCGCKLAIASGQSVATLSGLGLDVVDPTADGEEPPVDVTGPDDLAYVMFTSGSTGQPKGVMVPHRALANYIRWAAKRFDAKKGGAHLSASTFDLALTNMFAPLAAGGECEILPGGVEELADRLSQGAHYGFLSLATSHMHMLSDLLDCPVSGAAETVVLGAEVVVPGDVEQAMRYCRSARVVNEYGPTEATVGCTYFDATPEAVGPGGTTPIGRAIAGTELHVLDRQLQPVPNGVPGRLYVGGVGVAWGYLGKAALTADRFLPSPFGDGDRLYDTGDVVRRLGDGSLEFIRRADRQVKLHGFRIEPSEIEAAAYAVSGVTRCFAAVCPDGGGSERLILWVMGDVEVDDVRNELRDRLPDYMLPDCIVRLDRMPLTVNGKLDVASLPIPDGEIGKPDNLSEKTALSVTEHRIATVWQEILGTDVSDAAADFFALGGNSLTATRLLARLKTAYQIRLSLRDVMQKARRLSDLAALVDRSSGEETGLSINDISADGLCDIWSMFLAGGTLRPDDDPFEFGATSLTATRCLASLRKSFPGLTLRDLYRHRTPRALAARLETVRHGGDGCARPVALSGHSAALTAAQSRLLLLAEMFPEDTSYHVVVAFFLDGPLDRDAFALAVGDLQMRHDALRVVIEKGEDPCMRLVEPTGVPIEFDDGPIKQDEVTDFVRDFAHQPFDLETGPLWRLGVRPVQGKKTRHIVALSMHHIVSDGWSVSVMLEELSTLYAARASKSGSILPSAPSYLNQTSRADWTNAPDDASRRYWRERLDDIAQVVSLGDIRPRPLEMSFEGRETPVILDDQLEKSIRDAARRSATTVNAILLSTLAILVGRLSREQRFAIGVPFAGRLEPDTQRAVGLFVNAVALPVDVPVDASVTDIVTSISDTLIDASDHQHVPFDVVVSDVLKARDVAIHPIYQIGFNGLGEHPDTLPFGDLSAHHLPVEDRTSKLDINLYVSEPSGCLNLRLVWNSALFTEARMDAFVQQYRAVLQSVCEGGDVVGRIALPPAGQLDGAVGKALPAAGLLERIDTVCRSQPDRLAVSAGETNLDYRALDQRADTLAVALASGGVAAGATVLLLAEKHWRLPVAMLACLRLGAAFAVVDAIAPGAWLDRLRKGVRPAAMVAAGGDCSNATLEELGADNILCLGVNAPGLGDAVDAGATVPRAIGNLPVSLTYTSGSTGVPRAVLMDRSSLDMFADWYIAETELSPNDRSAVLSALGHDPLVRDVLVPFAAGASIHLPPVEGNLVSWLKQVGATITNVTPGRWTVLAEEADVVLPKLRVLLFGGERVEPSAIRQARIKAPHARILNAYGTTETAQIAAWGEAEENGVSALTSASSGNGLHVQGPDGQPAGIGEVGEVAVVGSCVAIGYWNAPGQTAQRFVPSSGGLREYRTGDLGRMDVEGRLEILGRADDELNLSGQRINPAEVAGAIRSIEGIRDAFVGTALSLDGTPILAAWVETAEALDAGGLSREVSQRLPVYLCPRRYSLCEALPRLANGKVDRAKLPVIAPDVGGDASVATVMEQRVAKIMADCLGCDTVGPNHDFFALGGHSLLAMRLVARIAHAFGVSIPLVDLFQDATSRGIAARIDGGLGEEKADRKGVAFDSDRYSPFPLTDLQEAYWIGRTADFDLGTGAHTYVEIACDRLDIDRFRSAVGRLVERHDMLRAVISPDGTQSVLPNPGAPDISVLDLRDCNKHEAAAQLQDLRVRMEGGASDLSCWPLFSFAISRHDDGDRIHFGCELIIADAWSFGIMARDLGRFYNEPALELPALSLSFRSIVLNEHQRRGTAAHDGARNYWADRLPTMPGPISLPQEKAAAALSVQQYSRTAITLSADEWARLSENSARRRLTPSTAILAAYAETLAQFAEEQHFLLTLTLFNRPQNEDEIGDVVGDFTSVNIFEVDARSAVPFCDFASTVQAQLWADLDHASYGGLSVLRDLSRQRGNNVAAIPVVFTSVLGTGAEGGADTGLPGTVVYRAGRTPQVAMDCIVHEADGKLVVELNVVEGIFYDGFVSGLQEVFERRLRGLAASAGWDEALAQSLPREQEACRAEVNATALEIVPQRLETGFLMRAAEAGDRVAVIDDAGQASYAEVASAAGAVAQALGPSEGRIVGIQMDKDRSQIAAVIGVLAAGGAYLPLAPDLPAARLEGIVAQAGIDTVLTQSWLQDGLMLPDDVRRVPVDSLAPGQAPRPGDVPGGPDALAYVIMTSGSTGTPKGVAMTHGATWNTIADVNRRFGVGPQDRVLSVSALTFDLSVWDIFGLLSAGGAVVLPSMSERPDPEAWLTRMARDGVTVWNSVPALMEILLSEAEGSSCKGLEGLRVALASGDVVPGDLGARLRSHAPEASLWALGGATEAAIWSNFKAATSPVVGAVAYGRPLSNQRFYVLDEAMRARPDHVPGEMWIAGRGLAQGYLGDGERTSERFVVHPHTGERLYRTGDMGRYVTGGDLEFLGRRDFQVKVQGHRIELGEIEAALSSHEGVGRAVAAAPGVSGQRRLVAYVVAVSGERLAEASLLAHLRDRLPGYMVPGRVVVLDRLPLTANGKVDRKALPLPSVGGEGAAPAEVTGLAAQVAAVWSEVLGRPVGGDENWFTAGGDSVSAARVAARLREGGLKVTIRTLFAHPSPVQLAAAMQENGGVPSKQSPAETQRRPANGAPRQIKLAPRGGVFPLTLAQEAMVRAAEISADPHAYILSISVRLKGALHIGAMEQALTALVLRHEALRTRFVRLEGDYRQEVLSDFIPDICIDDLRGLAPDDLNQALAAATDEEQAHVFDLQNAPPIRFRIIQADGDENRLCVTVHHLLVDAWSFDVMLSDIDALYRAALVAGESDLPDLPVHYADFAVHQRNSFGPEAERAVLDYWRGTLQDCPAGLALPFDRPPHAGKERPAGWVDCQVPQGALTGLEQLSNETGASLFMALMTIWGAVLARYGGTRDVVVGTPVHGRDMGEVEALVGCFVNTVPVRCDLAGNLPFSGLLARMKTQILDAFENASVPFGQIVADCQLSREHHRAPGFQVSFIMHNAPEADRQIGDLSVISDAFDAGVARNELSLVVTRTASGWSFRIKFDETLFDPDTVGEISNSLVKMMEAVVAAPDTPLARIDISAVDMSKSDGGTGDVGLPVPLRVRQAAMLNPSAVAVCADGESLTYDDLEKRSDALAAELRAAGCGRESVVAVCVGKRLLLPVVFYAVWKAGGAWLPLDENLPDDRLKAMLVDAGAIALVTDLKTGLAPDGVPVLAPDAGTCKAIWQPMPSVVPTNLAYVIYTSGSTGTPKGVEVEHRQFGNYLSGLGDRFPMLSVRRIAMAQSPAVDFGLTTFWSALSVGAELHIINRAMSLDPCAFGNYMVAHDIEWLKMSPTHLNALVAAAPEPKDILPSKVLMLGGEGSRSSDVEFYRTLKPEMTILNHYGPTEATVGALAMDLADIPAEFGRVPIGWALPNARVEVMDAAFVRAPSGAIGEICLGGGAPARGYRNRPALTAERFVPDPYASGGRLYRTGDLGRVKRDGPLYCLGRTDNQIKIRGFRVEPAEIEMHLTAVDGVMQAHVEAYDDGSDIWIAAFVCLGRPDIFDEEELLNGLAQSLPEYMVPTRIVALDDFPLTANGKIDRKALPRPGRGMHRQSYVAPRDDIERDVAALFKEVLGASRVGATDDFFALGGHSIAAVHLLARLRDQAGVALTMVDLFHNPTVAGVAEAMRNHRGPKGNAVIQISHDSDSRHEPFQMTEIQQAYWLGRTDEFDLGNTAAHSYWEYRADGLDLERFQDALRHVIARHDMLRAIVLPGGELQVLDDVPAFEITKTDMRGKGDEAFEAARVKVRREMEAQVFDVSVWPLLDVQAVLGDDGRLSIHIGVDIIIGDAWSFIILGDELARYYADTHLALPPMPITFRDYVTAFEQLRQEEAHAKARGYWEDRLDTLPGPPVLPFARDPSSIDQPTFERTRLRVEPEIWGQIKTQAAAHGVTPSAMVLTAYAEALAVHAEDPGFVLNLTLFNRLPLHEAVNALVGDFTSVTLLEVDAGGAPIFRDLVRRVQERLWSDLDNRTFSGIDVMRAKTGRQGGQRYHAPMVFTSVFGAEDLVSEVERQYLPMTLEYREGQTPQAWIDHMVVEEGGALLSVWNVVEGIFYDGFVSGLQEVFERRLRGLAASAGWDEALAQSLPREQEACRAEVNATALEIVPQRLETGFLMRAAEAGDRVAVIDDAGQASYAEVASAAGAVAQALGPSEGRIVGIQMDKDRSQIAAVIGVLAAGGAYLPLAPDLPAARLEGIVAQAGIDTVLTQSWLQDGLMLPDDVRRVPVDSLAPGQAPRPGDVPGGPDALAYVIMTSGSTGTPKGVAMTHGATWNTIADVNRRFGVGPQDRVLSVSALTFDLSVWDIFGLLSAGGAVVLPSMSERPDPEAWLTRMARDGVTVWNSVPALMEILLSEAEGSSCKGLEGLRVALASGDVVPGDLGARLRSHAPEASLWALGGATEAAIWSNFKAATSPVVGAVAYGRPLSNQRFYVLDEAMRARPDHVPGEMWIAGRGLAQGYLGDGERTSERFVVHPHTGERLYRTGDMGRYVTGGDLEFLGRRDFQVKVQGHRIELGEIEAALSSHEGVGRAVAAAPGVSGQRRLVAYVVAVSGERLAEASLLAHLRDRLPGYMVPGRVVVLDRLPLTANGKVDRKALPLPSVGGEGAAPAEVTGLAAQVAAVWSEVLGRPVGGDENWFTAGGDSVSAARVAARLREGGLKVTIRTLFAHPSPVQLAAAMRENEVVTTTTPSMPETAPPEFRRLASITQLTDSGAIEKFTAERHGIRHLKSRSLPIASELLEEPGLAFARRNHRVFADGDIRVEGVLGLLSGLRCHQDADRRMKLRYGSAGGLYPVQAYIYIPQAVSTRGCVVGMPPGVYYFNPVETSLVPVIDEVDLPVTAFGSLNQTVAEAASFSLFLVSDLAAIAPVYGMDSLRFSLIEAGAMTQLIEERAVGLGIGLCHAGTFDFETHRHALGFGETHALMHTLLGGLCREAVSAPARADDAPFVEETL